MSTFNKAVNGLVQHIKSQWDIPEYQNIWVIETTKIEFTHRDNLSPLMTFKRSDIHDIKDFEQRYAELKSSGVPWINIISYGLLPGAMLLGVESSSSDHYCTPDKVEVRFSGPPLSASGLPQWYVFDRVQITD